ncbi:MAG: hypothetical protein ABEN55_13530 [Bradymonadaceae bacterium]
MIYSNNPYTDLDDDATLREKLEQIADEMEECDDLGGQDGHHYGDVGVRRALRVIADEHDEIADVLRRIADKQDNLAVWFA